MKYKYYTASIACRDSRTRTITITTDADNSNTKVLDVTACSLEMDSDEDVFTPIRAMRGKLTIQCNDDDLSVEDLMPSSITAHSLTISSSAGIEFSGYVTAESFSQSYPVQGTSFDIQFISRLGIADKIDFSPLEQITPNNLCPIASILKYCFNLLRFPSSSTMTIPVVWENASERLYTDTSISLYTLCNYTDIESKNIFTTPSTYAAKQSGVTVKDVLETIAKTFLFTITENGNNISCITPYFNKTFVQYQLSETLPNVQPGNYSVVSGTSVTSFSTNYTDSTISYKNGSHRVAVKMKMDATEHPWKIDEYKFIRGALTAIPGCDSAITYGQASKGNLMTVTGNAKIVDTFGQKELKKCVYIETTSQNESFTLTLKPQSYLNEKVYKNLYLDINSYTYYKGSEEEEASWHDSIDSATFNINGLDYTPSIKRGKYLFELAKIEHLDPTHSHNPPYIGELKITIKHPYVGYYLMSIGDCEVELMESAVTLENTDTITYQHYTDMIGDDYEIETELCDHVVMAEFQLNSFFKDGTTLETNIGQDLRNKLKEQKCSNWHSISFTSTIRSLNPIHTDGGKYYLMTGFSRDYMAQKDKIQLTSIQQ